VVKFMPKIAFCRFGASFNSLNDFNGYL
jgi:hypothetical protein